MFQGDGSVRNVTYNLSWVKTHVTDLEAFAQKDLGEEKGKAYLGLWLSIRENGLRDRQSVRLFIAKMLMPYPWFKGDETISEALRSLHRIEFFNCGLMAKKHAENSKWFWDKKIGDISVREYWVNEGMKMRQKAQQMQEAHAQAQPS